MQIITHDKLAKYALPDTDTITDNGMIEVRGTKDFNIGDLTFADVVIHTGVEDVPDDWIGNKYFYDGTWSLNSDYVN